MGERGGSDMQGHNIVNRGQLFEVVGEEDSVNYHICHNGASINVGNPRRVHQ